MLTIIINDKVYYLLNETANHEEYIIPIDQLRYINPKIGITYKFRKIFNEKQGKSFLEILESESKHYKVGAIYEFKILNYLNVKNGKGELLQLIEVEDIYENKVTVNALNWQKPGNWHVNTVKCEILNFKNGLPVLRNRDDRHPIFTVGKQYDFIVFNQKTKDTANGPLEVFEVLGEDKCAYEVPKLQGQIYDATKQQNLQCKILSIGTNVKLLQKDYSDEYFVKFEEIVNKPYLEKKYFTPIFDNTKQNIRFDQQLNDQYLSGSAFWVFTFTNKILIKNFKSSIDRQDFKIASEINDLIIIFESWILSKGIIKSFPEEEYRSVAKTKAKKQLDSSKVVKNVLNKINSNNYSLLADEHYTEKQFLFEELYYIVSFVDISILDSELLIKRIIDLSVADYFLSHNDKFYLHKLFSHISYHKSVFIDKEENEYFSLLNGGFENRSFSEKEITYLNLSFVEIQILKMLDLTENFNLLIGQTLKFLTRCLNSTEEKKKILNLSYYYFQNYISKTLTNPFKFEGKILVKEDLLISNLVSEVSSEWFDLERLQLSREAFTVRVIRKSKTGYEVTYNSMKGFLPIHHVKNKILKTYLFEECDFTIDARCLNLSKDFNFFIVEEITGDNFKSHDKIDFEKGKIYECIIKNVTSFGVFVATIGGEGLLHCNHIFDFLWNRNNINQYFKSGQRIKLIVKDLDLDGRPNFSFVGVKEIDLLYYENYVESLFNIHSNAGIENIHKIKNTLFDTALIEKAFCIEKFAVLQNNLNEKIHNLQIAKQFYINANHARSFLINIYNSYFEFLLKIQKALNSKSLDNIFEIKTDAQFIKKRISQKTVETFPDSDKLIHFLEIVSLFNEADNSSNEILFNYIQNYDFLMQKDLKTIAKITLANNLLVSESEEDLNFSLKNLRLIYDYISNGIFSLDEAVDDRNARELKEELMYISELIKGDESQTLEFKSSLFTPILDDKSTERLEKLSKIPNLTDTIKLEISRINGDLAKKAVLHSSMKTLVAFANSKGGTLLIGVNDNMKIVGLEKEVLSFKKKDQNRDGFGKYFDDLIRDYIGDSFSSLMNRKFIKFPEGDILKVEVKESSHEIFLQKNEEGKNQEQLYIRNLSSTKELKGSDLSKFIKNKYIIITQ